MNPPHPLRHGAAGFSVPGGGVVPGVVVPGVVGAGDGAYPATPPWYGSGPSSNSHFVYPPHWHGFGPVWPCLALLGPVWPYLALFCLAFRVFSHISGKFPTFRVNSTISGKFHNLGY